MPYSDDLKQKIKDKLYQADGFRLLKSRKEYPEDVRVIMEEIYQMIPWKTESLQEAVHVIVHDIMEQPVCQVCGKVVGYFKEHYCYRTYCSKECQYVTSGMKGKSMPESARKAISEKATLRLSDSTKNPMYGKHFSEESKKLMSESAVKRGFHPNCAANLNFTGRIHSEETKKRMSAIAKETGTLSKPSVREKIYASKKRNGTFKDSKPEREIANLIREIIPDLQTQHKTTEYPFRCDFYIPSLQLYIEYNGTWTHGKRPFDSQDPECISKLEEWKPFAEESGYYRNAIENWTLRDPSKRKAVFDNDLFYLELWSMKEAKKLLSFLSALDHELSLSYTRESMEKDLQFLKEKECPDYGQLYPKNKLIYHYQPHFYEVEKKIWHDPAIKAALLKNRQKYLFKPFYELTDAELLRGFKISGVHRGFSHFNPLWLKQFVKEYQVKSVYDPCGGWGHRLFGAMEIDYIYNDIDSRSYGGVLAMFEDFKDQFPNQHKMFYNQDASYFIPEEEYECVFTCPPYFDTEDYTSEATSTKAHPSYSGWLNIWWRGVVRSSLKSSVKTFAYVVNERYFRDMNRICEEEGLILEKKIILGRAKSHYTKQGSSYEAIQVFHRS